MNPVAETSKDALVLALRQFVYRNLMNAADDLMEEVGWTPITVAYADACVSERTTPAPGR